MKHEFANRGEYLENYSKHEFANISSMANTISEAKKDRDYLLTKMFQDTFQESINRGNIPQAGRFRGVNEISIWSWNSQ